MFPRSLASITIPQAAAMAKKKPANRAGKLTVGYHRPGGAVSNVILPGLRSVPAATVPGIREPAAAEGWID